MLLNDNVSSPSRKYVAIVYGFNLERLRFKVFELPRGYMKVELTNDVKTAAWYYLNVLDLKSCIMGCFPFENFFDLTYVGENDTKAYVVTVK